MAYSLCYSCLNTDAKKETIDIEKLVEPMKKDKLPTPPFPPRKIKSMKLKVKTKLVGEVIDAVQTSSIIEENNLIKFEH